MALIFFSVFNYMFDYMFSFFGFSSGNSLQESSAMIEANPPKKFAMVEANSPKKFAMVEADSSFIAKMKKIFDEGKNADIEIHVDDKVFKVMKIMLCEHSPVFRAMFEYDTEEKLTNIVKIKGHDQEIVKKFLFYFYSGQVENLDAITHEIFALADYYQVEDLKKTTLQTIYANLNVDSVFGCFELAEKFQLAELKEKSIEFIKKNFTPVVSSIGWQNFDDKFKLVIFNLIAQELATSSDGELLVKEKSPPLTVEKVRKLNFSYKSCDYEGPLVMKNNGKKRLAYRIFCVNYPSLEVKFLPKEGFIEPGEKCAVKIQSGSSSGGKATVLYEINDNKNIKDCFKSDSFIRQVPFEFRN